MKWLRVPYPVGLIAGAIAALALGLFPDHDRTALFDLLVGVLILVSAVGLFTWAKAEQSAKRRRSTRRVRRRDE